MVGYNLMTVTALVNKLASIVTRGGLAPFRQRSPPRQIAGAEEGRKGPSHSEEAFDLSHGPIAPFLGTAHRLLPMLSSSWAWLGPDLREQIVTVFVASSER